MELILTQPSLRTNKLGLLGEELAENALRRNGFHGVKNLNSPVRNRPFADLYAERDGFRYFISVKTRNEIRDCGARINESYNCFSISQKRAMELKALGKTTEEITRIAIAQIQELADAYGKTLTPDREATVIPAWITVPVRPEAGTYAVYFGTLDSLGLKRAIPMTAAAVKTYECLVDWTVDERIVPSLSNQAYEAEADIPF